jgi:hypothetical protein
VIRLYYKTIITGGRRNIVVCIRGDQLKEEDMFGIWERWEVHTERLMDNVKEKLCTGTWAKYENIVACFPGNATSN